MSPYAQLTSEQLKEIMGDQSNTDKSTWDVQMQVENAEGVLDQANTSSVLDRVFSEINNQFEPECFDESVR